VRVFGGYDSVSQKRHYLMEWVQPGPNAEREVEKAASAGSTRSTSGATRARRPRSPSSSRSTSAGCGFEVPLIPAQRAGVEVGGFYAVDAHLLDSFYPELRRCRIHCDGSKRIDHRSTTTHECDRRCKPHECQPLGTSTVRRIHFLLFGALKRAVAEIGSRVIPPRLHCGQSTGLGRHASIICMIWTPSKHRSPVK
jgi:integrase